MRPLAGDDALGRPRTSNMDDLSSFSLPAAPQMTYFLADESAIGSSTQPPQAAVHRAKEKRRVPVAETPDVPRPRPTSRYDIELDNRDSTSRPSSSKGPLDSLRHNDGDSARPISPFPKPLGTPSMSQPLTPALVGVSGPASAISSVSSRRNSFCLSEDLGSHTPSMRDGDAGPREEDAEEEREPVTSSAMMDSGSAPQLIMPSIKMPSRRPFTDEGKRMGRLKVLIAGDSGVGKTSLIKAVVQSCEHIVHVDPITPSSVLSSSVTRSMPTIAASSTTRQRSSRRGSPKESAGTSQITEIYASTKPYPEWWSEMDDLCVLRRRKSLGDAVLDRNICFVDTPGYGSGSSSMDTITPVVQYIEAHLQRINQNSLSDGDVLNLLGGEGGIQVDLVFYMVSNRLRPVDIHYLQQLAPLTNIILLLAQADLMSAEQVAASKEQIHSQLHEANINLFSFSVASQSCPSALDADRQGVYAISSATGSDHDLMDASLLMSPDYVQPLIPTELGSLVEQVFSSNGVSWLRHSVARKYVQWRKGESNINNSTNLLPRQPSSYNPIPFISLNGPSQVLTPPVGAASSYALARLADHTQREERLAQVRLANWAADLQKSLAREREQYAALARGERAMWLAEKINECIEDGSLVPRAPPDTGDLGTSPPGRRPRAFPPTDWKVHYGYGPLDAASPPGADGDPSSLASSPRMSGERRHRQQYYYQQHRQRQDPLGLLEVADELKHKGLIALEVLGSLGVLGGLALWVTRHYLHLPAYGWLLGEWERFWYGVGTGGGR